MPPTAAVSLIAPRASRLSYRGIARIVLATAILVGSTRAADAQTASDRKSRFEFLVSSGSLVPIGAQRDAIKRGDLTAAQLSYLVRPGFAVTSSIGWTRSRDITTAANPKLDVFTYDVGAEARANRWFDGSAVTFRPFAGVGAGARSYNYRSLNVDATHNLAAYGSVGGELGYRRVRLRLEARDYVTGFKPLVAGGATGRRNDVAVMAGLHIVAR